MSPALIVAVCSAILIAGLILLYSRIAFSAAQPSFSPEWWEHFSPSRYAPLGTLLREDDFTFLRSMRGFEPSMERELRLRRVRICQSFLREMREDFLRLQGVGQALLAAGQTESGFQDELFRQRVRFSQAWWSVRLQLIGYRFGLGHVDATGLIQSLSSSAARLEPVLTPAA